MFFPDLWRMICRFTNTLVLSAHIALEEGIITETSAELKFLIYVYICVRVAPSEMRQKRSAKSKYRYFQVICNNLSCFKPVGDKCV